MIIADLYSTDLTLSYTSPQTKMTKSVDVIPITTESFTDAYWLGWIKYENIPQVFKTSQVQYSGSGNTRKVKFADITKFENVDFTYVGTHSTTYNNGNYSCDWGFDYFDETNQKWVYSAYGGFTPYIKLLNEMEFQAFALGSISLRISVVSDYAIGRYSVQWSNNPINLTIQDFIAFMNGTLTVNVTFYDYYTSQTMTVTVTGTDFGNDGLFQVPNTSHKLFINYYEFTKKRRNVYNSYDNITPLLNTHITSDEIQSVVTSCRTPNATGDYSLLKFTVDSVNEKINGTFYSGQIVLPNYGTGNEIPVNITGINAEFSFDDLLDYTTYPKINGNAIIGHNSELTTNPNFCLMLYPIIKLSDIYKHASLFRWTDSNYADAGYSDGHIYYPKVNIETNEILCELITGGQEIVPQLASWEYGTIISNNYKPSDKPSPSPTPSGDNIFGDGNAEIGNGFSTKDRLLGLTGDTFSTYYDLCVPDVLGLLAQLTTTASTFWEALGTATDYKQQNILDYIISFRRYPFNVYDSSDSVANKLQFGYNAAAQVDLSQVTGYPSYKLSSSVRVFEMGYISVPTFYGSYSKDDRKFIDFEPYTTCKAYLPFLGIVDLKSIDVIGHTVYCYLILDLVTGMGTYYLDTVSSIVRTIFTGSTKLGADITVAGNDIVTQSANMASSYINAAKNITGVIANPIAEVGSNSGIAGNAMAERASLMKAGMSTASAGLALAAYAGNAAVNIATTAAKEAVNVASSRRAVPQSVNSGSGFGNLFCDYRPRIIVERPTLVIPATYGHEIGYPLNQSKRLSEMNGLVVCANPDLSGINALEEEKRMIYELLTTGVYM